MFAIFVCFEILGTLLTFFFLKKKQLFFYWFWEREKHPCVGPHSLVDFSFSVPWPGSEPTTSVHQDKALTRWPAPPGLGQRSLRGWSGLFCCDLFWGEVTQPSPVPARFPNLLLTASRQCSESSYHSVRHRLFCCLHLHLKAWPWKTTILKFQR